MAKLAIAADWALPLPGGPLYTTSASSIRFDSTPGEVASCAAASAGSSVSFFFCLVGISAGAGGFISEEVTCRYVCMYVCGYVCMYFRRWVPRVCEKQKREGTFPLPTCLHLLTVLGTNWDNKNAVDYLDTSSVIKIQKGVLSIRFPHGTHALVPFD